MAERVPTTLVTFGARPREETRGRLRVRILGPARRVRGQAANPFALSLFAALRDADVIHCHQQHVVASSAAALFGRLTGVLMSALMGLIVLLRVVPFAVTERLAPLTEIALGVLLATTVGHVAALGWYNLRIMTGRVEAEGRVVGDVREGR